MHLLRFVPSMKFGLSILALFFCLTLQTSPANAQNVPPPPNGATPYAVPPQVPAGTPPMPMMQTPPPQGYGAPDPNQQWAPLPYGAPQWGPPQGAPVDPSQMQMGVQGYPPPTVPGPDPTLMAQQGYPPAQGYPPPGAPPQYGAPAYPPQYPPETPRAMSAYEQQEAALRDSEMVGQLEDAKQQKEMEESFRNGVLAEFDDGKNGTPNTGFNGDQSKVKSGAKKAGSVLKGGMRAIAPTASWIGTFFILNAATGGF